MLGSHDPESELKQTIYVDIFNYTRDTFPNLDKKNEMERKKTNDTWQKISVGLLVKDNFVIQSTSI